jgi:ABC-type molybdenum transport system ATPase subunit/photorepair protein PhrA
MLYKPISKKMSECSTVKFAAIGDPMDIDETEKDISPTSNNIKLDGIEIGTEHLERKELVNKLATLVEDKTFVLLSSPAGSGKNSLFKLYKHHVKGKEAIGISCLTDDSGFDLLSRVGIDLHQCSTH